MKKIFIGFMFIVLVLPGITLFDMQVLGQEEQSGVKITNFSFEKKKLSFKISNFQQKELNEKSLGHLGIRVKITKVDKKPIFDQKKEFKTAKKEINISIPFFKIKDGKYNFYVGAIDFLTKKNATVSKTIEIKTLNKKEEGQFSINYSWRSGNMCENGHSPKINLVNVPEGTKRFRVTVTDLDLRSFDHGGGNVKYKGKKYINSGALRKYYGPCPPSGVTHNYSIVVTALNAKNQVIGNAEYTQPCSG